MKPVLSLAALALAALTTSSQASVYTFNFMPTSGYDFEATGTISTDDAPVESGITAVMGAVNGYVIDGIDINGANILDLGTLSGYFSFTAGGLSFSFGPSFFDQSALTGYDSDGNEYVANGTLDIKLAGVGAVPLPAGAPMFGGALVMLAALGTRRTRGTKHTA